MASGFFNAKEGAKLRYIEAHCRSFLWSGTNSIRRRAPIAWNIVCEPKKKGGQQLISLIEWNVATLGKLLWNINAKDDKMWVCWIHSYYIN